ncbi:hypothetical protein Purlil1_14347 [Purpureocillium lilacinum]|uniref:Reverse transcriptase n=1 Tax=Purpureocillium lilacinum TaxID=33203 RepID=A0ABR0BBI7_PURLI|nr:hypothetical protein Purlil1_14347 [Purpureocillium lilacinum]
MIMDSSLKYKEHMARASAKGLESAMELQRLRGLTPATARQLFTAMVAPIVDYASNVWMHACRYNRVGPINRVQRAGAQAIVGTFMTVATSIAEAEAHIPSAQERFWRRAVKMWTDMHTLPTTNPLRNATKSIRKFKRFCIETGADGVMHVAVSSSARNGLVGSGAVIELSPPSGQGPGLERHSFTLGLRTEQNPFSGELAAIAQALRCLPEISNRSVEVLTSNKAAVLTLRNPRQQSGQQYVDSIHETIGVLRNQGNVVTVTWVPVSSEHGLLKLAKGEAREATREGATPAAKFPRARSTTLGIARAKQRADNKIPSTVGDFTKRIDGALPGKHTRQLYGQLTWKEANVLAQLRTGMARLNDYLYRIKATASQHVSHGNDTMHEHTAREHFVLPGRQATIGQ